MRHFLAAVLIACFSLTANAAVVTFNVSQSWTQGGSSADTSGYIGITGTGETITVDPGSSGQYFDFILGGGSFGTTGDKTSIGVYDVMRSYGEGSIIGAGNFTAQSYSWASILSGNQPTSPKWNASHSGALAFLTAGGLYGYLLYDFERDGALSTMNILSGGYETVQGASIAVPGVPIPAAVWLFGSALAGLGWMKRRATKLAAAASARKQWPVDYV